jgi:hypothetical protein
VEQREEKINEGDGSRGREHPPVAPRHSQPNQGVQLTASSVRCALASGSSGRPAFGFSSYFSLFRVKSFFRVEKHACQKCGSMPTVLREGPYSFIFFSSDRGEPPHIHVQRERSVAKFWLEPVALVTNRGFRAHELRRITRLVIQHQATLLEAWHDYFGT